MLHILLVLAATALSGPAQAEESYYYRNVTPGSGGTATPSAGTNNPGGQAATNMVLTSPAPATGRTGRAYAGPAPQASQSSGAVSWSWGTANPPPWATVDPLTGIVRGQPSGAGTYTDLTLKATDAKGSKLTSPFSIEVLPLPAITMADGNADTRLRVGETLAIIPSATGIHGTPTWTMPSLVGTLPAGSQFDSATGRVSGVLTGPGTGQFTLSVRDGFDDASADGPTTRVVAYPTLAFTSSPSDIAGPTGTPINRPAPGMQGVAGTATFGLSQGAGDITSTFPTTCPGLSVNTGTGTISGTPQSACSLQGLRLTARDDGAGRANLAGTVQSGAFAVSVTTAVPASSQKFASTGPNITLSNNNLTASFQTGAAGSASIAKALNPISGKGYFEVTITAMPGGNNTGIGVVSANTSLSSYIGNDSTGVAAYSNGVTYFGGGSSFMGSFKTGDVIMVAYSAGEIWFGKNGVWGRNPSTEGGTGTGSANIPAVSLNFGSSVTANFTSATAYPVPAGFHTLP